MRKLGFALDHFDNFGAWSPAHPNIENHAYLFRRR
jgi:hypothetical protein